MVEHPVSERDDVTDGQAGEEAAAPLAALPDPPRPLTPRVRRHSWTEPHARSWGLVASVVTLVTLYFLGAGYYAWWRDVKLIREGREVSAFIYAAEGYPIPGRHRPPTAPVELHYEVDGRKYEVEGFLRGRTEPFVVQTYVPIHVDPDDPTRWTARTRPDAVWPEMLGGLILLPAVPILAAVAWFRRARVLRLWRDGRAVEAVVLESHQTALAPRSRFLRCAPADPSDSRVIGVYVPDRAGRLAPGDSLWLLTDPAGGSRAAAALWLQ
jgi:hypothetical protein